MPDIAVNLENAVDALQDRFQYLAPKSSRFYSESLKLDLLTFHADLVSSEKVVGEKITWFPYCEEDSACADSDKNHAISFLHMQYEMLMSSFRDQISSLSPEMRLAYIKDAVANTAKDCKHLFAQACYIRLKERLNHISDMKSPIVAIDNAEKMSKVYSRLIEDYDHNAFVEVSLSAEDAKVLDPNNGLRTKMMQYVDCLVYRQSEECIA